MQRSRATHSPATKVTRSKSSPNSHPPSNKLFRTAGQSAGCTSSTSSTTTTPKKMLGETRISPSNPSLPDPYSLQYGKTALQQATKPTLDDLDRSSLSDNDSVQSPQSSKHKPAPGKKTRGRVKIEMQYIQNKLRRYTTFSKRKSGMMKKAYELSTLTGTQVMLLVASETGHVYTFATPKLQPMITSDAGKALIQTCLHTPDPPQALSEYDMRMSASGYEETELSYAINDDDAFKSGLETSPTHMVPPGHMQQHQQGPVVAIPQGMMPFTMQEPPQPLNNIMQHQSPYQPLSGVSQAPNSMPHTNSPPPTYSPTHPPSPPRNYPGSPPFSQSSHISHQQPMMMEDMSSASPMRKSPPETHYLSHHHYERSPSHSPMGHFQAVRATHSPPQQTMYSESSSIVNPSQMGHL